MARKKSNKHIPKKSKSKLKSANSLRGYQHCWCEGFDIGCGVVLTTSTRFLHAKRVQERKERNYSAQCANIAWVAESLIF